MTEQRKFWIRSIASPTQTTANTGLQMTPLVRNYAALMGSLAAYHGSLAGGELAHPLHAHDEEEIEVLLTGALEVITPERTVRIGPGSYHYHPPGVLHTIRSVGPEPATFFLLRWRSWGANAARAVFQPDVFDAATLASWVTKPGAQVQPVGTTLELVNGCRLETVAVSLPENSKGRLHTDPYDSLTVLLTGSWVGQCFEARAPALIFYPHAVPHGFSTPSGGPSLALCFKFYPPLPAASAS